MRGHPSPSPLTPTPHLPCSREDVDVLGGDDKADTATGAPKLPIVSTDGWEGGQEGGR